MDTVTLLVSAAPLLHLVANHEESRQNAPPLGTEEPHSSLDAEEPGVEVVPGEEEEHVETALVASSSVSPEKRLTPAMNGSFRYHHHHHDRGSTDPPVPVAKGWFSSSTPDVKTLSFHRAFDRGRELMAALILLGSANNIYIIKITANISVETANFLQERLPGVVSRPYLIGDKEAYLFERYEKSLHLCDVEQDEIGYYALLAMDSDTEEQITSLVLHVPPDEEFKTEFPAMDFVVRGTRTIVRRKEHTPFLPVA